MIEVQQNDDGSLQIDWDPKEPLESILNVWNEEDYEVWRNKELKEQRENIKGVNAELKELQTKIIAEEEAKKIKFENSSKWEKWVEKPDGIYANCTKNKILIVVEKGDAGIEETKKRLENAINLQKSEVLIKTYQEQLNFDLGILAKYKELK
jgi:hypothetical protein